MTVEEMETKKIKLISMITLLYDSKVIEELEKVLLSKKTDWWSQIDKKEKNAIYEGLQDYKNGKLLSNSEVMVES